GTLIASIFADSSLVVTDVLTDKELARFKVPPGGGKGLAFNADGRRLVSASGRVDLLVYSVPAPERGRPGKLTDAEAKDLWADLGKGGKIAFKAVARLASAGAPALAMLRKQIKLPVAAEDKAIQKWIAELDDDNFEVRDKAYKSLVEAGK